MCLFFVMISDVKLRCVQDLKLLNVSSYPCKIIANNWEEKMFNKTAVQFSLKTKKQALRSAT
jgi:hypothetical protein